MKSPFDTVRAFEEALCEFTGAPYAVTVNSCTMALLLAVKWQLEWGNRPRDGVVSIPNRTYLSVPMSIIHAGGYPTFRDEDWKGCYQLSPLPVHDSARMFGRGMYSLRFAPGDMVCVSFHATKVLADTQGGAILLDDPDAYLWLKRMRFDGRTEGIAPIDDTITEIGYHCYMSPDVAARLLHKIGTMGDDLVVLPNDNYPDLSTLGVFQ